MSKQLAVILNNVRSCENVGSILRTAEFFGFNRVYFVGLTPYPTLENDERLPHIREKLDVKIKKVSLGAEKNLDLHYHPNLEGVVEELKSEGWKVVALEQDSDSIDVKRFKVGTDKTALVLGTEVTGLNSDDLSLVDQIIEIPKFGRKESLNVSVAFGVVAFKLKSS